MAVLRMKSAALIPAILLLLAGFPGLAQTTSGIQFLMERDGGFSALPAAGEVTFQAPGAGQSVTARMRIVNVSESEIFVSSVILDGAYFSMERPSVPVRLTRGDGITFAVTYNSVSSARTAGQISVAYRADLIGTPRIATQALAGTAAQLRLSAITTDVNMQPLDNGTATLVFPPVQANSSSMLTLVIANTGTAPGSVDSISLPGLAFRAQGIPLLPAALDIGREIRFNIRFSPSSTGVFREPLNVTLGGRTVSVTLQGSAVAPDLRLAVLTADSNVLPLEDGSAVTFPGTPINGTSTVTLIVTNRGAAAATLDSVLLMGATAFRMQGVPLLPAVIEAGQELRIGIRFAPTETATFRDTLSVSLGGKGVTLAISGTATSALLRYDLLQAGSPTRTYTPGATVELPDTTVGSAALMTVLVTNTGQADGQVASISATGAFQVTDLPTLPATLRPGTSLVFTLRFAPLEARTETGRLRVGNDTFELRGNGAGPRIGLSYRLAETWIAVPSAGSVAFPPTRVGNAAALTFVVENKGNRPATLASISISQTAANFATEDLPALPLVLEPADSLVFVVRFRPVALGRFTGSLHVNSETISLTASADQPAPLPRFSFTGVSGDVEPMQQPAVGITLDEPYALPIRGTLTLAFESDTFAVDPALQFSTGSRTVTFTIAPGERQAHFSTGATNIRFQSGTVAGNVTLTPTFATADVDLTPSPAQALKATIAPAAPQLTSVQIGALSSTGVTFLITAASNTRTLQSIEIRFNIAQGATAIVQTPTITFDVSALADTYYRSAAGATFGGLILGTVPVSIGSSRSDAPGLPQIFESATVTVVNSIGRSNSITVSLR